ncbi:hypothetical protein C8Q75DRAFT_623211 [Abortiporus biennis]|nr:hypothetical protein C8Q75DRAFT_623211 [Abortiporus biennis]
MSPLLCSRGPSITPGISSNSLDISEVLTQRECDSILTTSLSFASSLCSTHSLHETPPFALIYDYKKPNKHTLATAFSTTTDPVLSMAIHPSTPTCHTTISVPTSPRLQSMLLEPIVITQWNSILSSSCNGSETPWQDHADDQYTIAPPWIAEGHILPPEAFQAVLRQRRTSRSGADNLPTLMVNDVNVKGQSPLLMLEKSPLDHPCSTNTEGPPSAQLAVPSITFSNSVASLLPVSLESSASLSSSVPLAIRRGLKAPAPLNITKKTGNTSDSSSLGLYPGIPTPFLGSPTSYNPTFQSCDNPKTLNLDLKTICGDLRSRCPPLSPYTEIEDEMPLDLKGCPSNLDDDDWGFAEEILADFYPDFPDQPHSGGPCTKSQYSPDSPVNGSSFSWSQTPTLTENNDITDGRDSVGSHVPFIPDISKQQRRKTVIIETASSTNTRRQTRVTLDLSDLSQLSHDSEHQPVPLVETPLCRVSFTPGRFSTSTPSRPPSSATMRAPVKGILKEKKCVRFSVLPSMHEYSENNENQKLEDAEDVEEDEAQSPSGRHFPSPGSKMRSAFRKSAPSERTDMSGSESGSPTRKSFGGKVQVDVGKSPQYRANFPKHPAVRSIREEKIAAPPGPVISAGPPGGKRKSSLIRRSAVTPTPDSNSRPPMKPKNTNGRQTYPPANGTIIAPKRKSSNVGPQTITQSSGAGRDSKIQILPSQIGGPKKLKANTPILPSLPENSPPKTRRSSEMKVIKASQADENKARRSVDVVGRSSRGRFTADPGSLSSPNTSPPKNRMGGQLRSILTKLRT